MILFPSILEITIGVFWSTKCNDEKTSTTSFPKTAFPPGASLDNETPSIPSCAYRLRGPQRTRRHTPRVRGVGRVSPSP